MSGSEILFLLVFGGAIGIIGRNSIDLLKEKRYRLCRVIDKFTKTKSGVPVYYLVVTHQDKPHTLRVDYNSYNISDVGGNFVVYL